MPDPPTDFSSPILEPRWAPDGRNTRPMWLPDPDRPRLPRPVRALLLGAGNRGNIYGDYGLRYPHELQWAGVAEPNEVRRKAFQRKHRITDEFTFAHGEDALELPRFADAVVVATPDHLHFRPAMAALAQGYDILLEKPISPSEEECKEILKRARETGGMVAVCHVLRYAPYFVQMQRWIREGRLGQLVSLQHLEPIGYQHMAHSYVRGPWRKAGETTPLILAKSCHDLDLLRWLVGRPCLAVQAFGGLHWFRAENAPAGSSERCLENCQVESECPYSARKIYHQDRHWLHHFDLPDSEPSRGKKIMEYLRNSDYGRCVYRLDNDQPDHYVANLWFDGGISASLSVQALTSYQGRRTRAMGSMGDLVGDMTQLTYTDFRSGEQQKVAFTGDSHGGGDWRLVADWVQAVAWQDSRWLSSTLEASIESHLMGFAAERSRQAGKIEELGR